MLTPGICSRIGLGLGKGMRRWRMSDRWRMHDSERRPSFASQDGAVAAGTTVVFSLSIQAFRQSGLAQRAGRRHHAGDSSVPMRRRLQLRPAGPKSDADRLWHLSLAVGVVDAQATETAYLNDISLRPGEAMAVVVPVTWMPRFAWHR